MSALYLALASITSASFYHPDLLPQCLAAAKEAWSIGEDRSLALPVVDLLPYFLANLFCVGDASGVRRLIDQGLSLAEETRLPYLQTLCRHAEALVAINEGRFSDAEAWATQALESGRRLDENQAAAAYGMQMFCIRREQGRLREALPMLQHFVRTTPKAQVWQPGLALLYAELDMRAECQAQFESLPWSRASTAPRDTGTLTVVILAAEVCVYLGDAVRASQLYPLLKDYAGTTPIVDLGGPCLGSVDRLLGKLDTVMERWELAQTHFEAALVMDQKSGSRVWLAHSRYAYAVMLHRRAQAGDLDRARVLLADALAESTALGMNALTPRISALAEAIAAPPPAYPCGLSEREVGVLRSDGDGPQQPRDRPGAGDQPEHRGQPCAQHFAENLHRQPDGSGSICQSRRLAQGVIRQAHANASAQCGRIFWLTRNTLLGSNWRFTATSRS